MRWPMPSLLLAVLSLVIFQESAADTPTVANRFTVLPHTAYCEDEDITRLNDYLADSLTLASGFQAAIKAAATSNTASGLNGRDGIVARKLFTDWFGIEFEEKNGVQIVQSQYSDAWSQIESRVLAVEAFLENGVITGPALDGGSTPYLFCSTSAAFKVDYGDTIFAYYASSPGSSEEIEINGQKLTVGDVYGVLSDMTPWYWPEINHYAYLMNSEFGDDLCLGHMAITFTGKTGFYKEFEGQLLDFIPTSQFILICGVLYDFQVRKLSDVVGNDPTTSGVTIDAIQAQASVTMFHELFHLTSYWTTSNTGSIIPVRDDLWVNDYANGAASCLSLAAGTLPDGNGNPVDPYFASSNADSYQYFAFSWWYYKQEWADIGPSLVSYAPATFYDGILAPWYS